MSEWFNYAATLKILVFGLLVGGALPALFAVGVRVNAIGANVPAAADGSANAKRSVLIALSWAIFLAVLAVVVIGVLFIARDFLGHHFGWYLLGAKPK
ncbi:hypothetical protein [Mycolicibacter kumamotonensis]|uniref:Transmembrane protein n=1 Tax=Mycolicibacter kumamotonensis TaxID=354243 RepID=A0A7K3LFK4_9MYCO|nr:hypothetical protein [Mycolicibacter kumamotonensis]NDJ90900.1 hypothetical protein [Mycolicibacter kumamotonensis]